MKMMISGGHLTPALAVSDFVLANHPDTKIVFVGRKYSQDSLKQLAHEYEEVKRRGLTFKTFWSPRLNHVSSWWQKIVVPGQLVLAVLRAIWLMILVRPSVFVTFGGYLAVPLSIAAWITGVPIVTHEQTRVLGQANRIITKLARKIAVSFEDSVTGLPAAKVVVTGNPLRPALFTQQPAKPTWLATAPRKPILYVTGGNQGSQVINTLIEQILPSLTKNWVVIHQCGNRTKSTHYKRVLERAKKRLSKNQQSCYYVFEWMPEIELAWVYQHAQAVVSRAGANTISELIALQVPSLLIPLPFSHHDEQQRNAEWLTQAGGAVTVLQKDISAELMLSSLIYLKNHQADFKSNLERLPVYPRAAEALYELAVQVGA